MTVARPSDASARAPASVDRGAFLELRSLTKTFGAATVVDRVDLELAEGEFFSILGPSGCGKTTTLRMVGGFERPSSGQILLDGQDIAPLPPDKRPVNTVFQSYALFAHLDVEGNVDFGLREARVGRRERRERVGEALALVRLEGYERRKPRHLSGGQQQRVALARAIVNRPRLLLLDEPLGALDLKLRRAMQLELKSLQSTLGTTFIYVTHDQEEALTMSDRVALMRDGRIAQVGRPEEIYDRPANAYVADFIGNANQLPGMVGSVSNGIAEVRLDESTTVRALADAAATAGRRAVVIVRPERCRLATPTASSNVNGTVKEVVFVGLHRALLIELADRTQLTVYIAHVPSEPPPPLPGTTVTVGWAPQDAWVVPEAPGA